MAYDPIRGRVVLFGGYDTDSTVGNAPRSGDTWEWDGQQWSFASPVNKPVPRNGHVMVYDPVRQRVLLHGGYREIKTGNVYTPETRSDLWEWNGVDWLEIATTGTAPARWSHAAAYDVVRSRLIVYGGSTPTPGDDETVYELDGTTWHAIAGGTGPGNRWYHAMAYHTGLSQTFLFGGGSPGAGTELWAWSGSGWQNYTSAGPSARSAASMTFDASRARLVLFGGRTSSTEQSSETWEWDNAGWIQRTSAGPSARHLAGIAYDAARARVVLMGGATHFGSSLVSRLADLWEWNGSVWLPRGRELPAARRYHAMAYDPLRGRTIVHGGSVATLNSPFLPPSLVDTWAWDGVGWTLLSTLGPGARALHAMAMDTARSRLVLFGGSSPSSSTNGDTWEFNGTQWMQITGPGTSAPARRGHAMAFDAARNRTVLYGGANADQGRVYQPRGDTYEWNGSTWTLATVTGPPPRYFTAMAYDGARGVVVLYGGDGFICTSAGSGSGSGSASGSASGSGSGSGSGSASVSGSGLGCGSGSGEGSFNNIPLCCLSDAYDDTWEWNGTVWTMRETGGAPGPRARHALAYDAARQRIVLYGGTAKGMEESLSSTPLDDTWEWDGAHWTLATSGSPPARLGHAMAFDTGRGRTVMVGAQESVADVWEYSVSGNACASGAACNSGFCTDGVCCEAFSCGTCERCSVAGAEGVCTPVGGVDSDSCLGGRSCEIQTLGSATVGVCGFAIAAACSVDSDCLSGHCADGVCCESACTGPCEFCRADLRADLDPATPEEPDGRCLPAKLGSRSLGRGGDCATTFGTVCDGNLSSCSALCADNRYCIDGRYCLGGSCQTDVTLGAPCDTAIECASGFCVDGVCCNSACQGECTACDEPSREGICSVTLVARDGDCAGEGTCEGTCAGSTLDSAQCIFPGDEADCGLCLVCDGNGACSQIPPTRMDSDCSVAACAELTGGECWRYEAVESTQCEFAGVCRTSEAVCEARAFADGTECSTGTCRDGVCVAKEPTPSVPRCAAVDTQSEALGAMLIVAITVLWRRRQRTRVRIPSNAR